MTRNNATGHGSKDRESGQTGQGALKGVGKRPAGAMNILTSIGEVVYEWSLGDDLIRWGGNARDVLLLESLDGIASGKKFAGLLTADSLTTPYETIVNSTAMDVGVGVPYKIEYELLPFGPNDDRKLWVEDMGRWYADETGKPVTAQGVLRVINAQHEAEQKRAYLSRFDALTGQINRTRLAEVLGETIDTCHRSRTTGAFVVISLDNLPTINDAYGFDVGDQIIAKVSNRIKSRLRGGDTLGRFSGNKFGVVLMNCGRDDIDNAAQRFLSSVSDEVITTDDGAVAATVTIGGVCLPASVKSVDETIAQALEALDAAKTTGRGSFVCYEASRTRSAARKSNLDLASDIVRGLNDQRLRMAYQPVMAADGQSVVFHECLMRLEQEDGTIVSAGDLMPVANKLGLVRLIDHRMMTLALEVLSVHPQAHLSVNVSPQSVATGEWLDMFAAGLRRISGNVASRMIVEITEAAAMQDLEETKRFISKVRSLGAKVALDDFGAGYTSFHDLKSLDLDIIKIDGSFIENLAAVKEDKVLVRTLVELAKTFAAETVAEWVSDADSAELLADMGIDHLQGNHFAVATLDSPWQIDEGEDLPDAGPTTLVA